MTGDTRPMTIGQQAEFIDQIAARCVMRDGSDAVETHMTVTKKEAEDLRLIAARLRRIAPHEDAIKHMVTGRR
ncbi:hypothetical protein D3227_04940 [Mesorhizobium waimense]|uniref:Uncharacterized protein n=1 Tax=Mesorhizobium waimense TaxID=1300307 RepID=A0A3A5KYT4_9HYPH|nr:hypothetical protein [Mesorhizobium waimense]RJT42025.1 hypothetical protein D3227_04940 [Mesorhizobium waimense]